MWIPAYAGMTNYYLFKRFGLPIAKYSIGPKNGSNMATKTQIILSLPLKSFFKILINANTGNNNINIVKTISISCQTPILTSIPRIILLKILIL